MAICAVSELAIIAPVQGRPHRVGPLLDSIFQATPDARVYFACDGWDEPMVMATEGAASYRAGWQSIRVLVVDGNYARKINEAVRATEEPYLLFGADDLRFRPDWFEVAKRRLVGHFGVVATNDLANKRNQYGLLATHPLVARWYAEMETIDGSPGPLYEGYPHEYVDREFSEVARFRGAFVHEPLSVVEHLHPMVGKAPMDQLYALQKQRMRVGKKIYAERRQMWT